MGKGAAVEGVGQIAVRVHDLDRAVAFYRDRLGFEFLFRIPEAAFLRAGAVRIMLSLPESPRFDHPASVIYYTVPDLDSAHEDLVRQGVEFEAEPHLLARMPDHDLWMAFLRDTEGNLLALMMERRPPAR